MIVNRSVPPATIIPVLTYEDVVKASDWLCDAFGFRVRLRVGMHRVQLVFGDGAVILSAGLATQGLEAADVVSHSVHVRVEDVDQHFARAQAHGARILHPPTDYPYGERQYMAEDLGGHRWTFSQSIADVAPEVWGGTMGEAD